ncbi:uncharacterized protein LOC113354187 [Papaver somniferum]|uniref:uncharacterized protein LOC113354187 n=1 Tax=Papaver somniferum TaxID=3469 RepID=UPI000E6F514D|nr:uncharacterized protein LOC113354187 [Papaver somniferum]
MGFRVKLRQWIRCCVEFTRFSILVNKSATGYFKSKKGIRQGDPISPFLFLLVGEALTFMIKRAQEQGLLSDDTLIFLDADIEQVKNLGIVLLSFEMLTGLKINFAKSQIFGVGYDGDLNAFSSLLGCYNGVLPTTYLGLPLGDKCGGVAKWDKVVDKVIARFPGWIKPLISRAGKITLINSVLATLPVYYMSLYEIPVSVLRKLEQIMRKFLWSDNKGKKKIHPAKCNALCKKKRFGGLGIKNLKLVNQYLLSKWSWRYATEEDVLWKQVQIAAMGALTDNVVIWNLNIPRRLTAATRTELDLLLADLQSFKFNQNQADELFWPFTTKRFFQLSTRDMLHRRRINVPENCLFCVAPENVSHLFLHCAFARSVWDIMTANLKWLYAMPEDVVPAIQAWQLFLSDNARSEIWELVPIAIIWCLWKERNNRVFNDNPNSATVVIAYKAIYVLFTWSLAFKEFEDVDSKEVSFLVSAGSNENGNNSVYFSNQRTEEGDLDREKIGELVLLSSILRVGLGGGESGATSLAQNEMKLRFVKKS